MLYFHFRPLDSTGNQHSLMQTHLHSKLLVIWILFGKLIIIIIIWIAAQAPIGVAFRNFRRGTTFGGRIGIIPALCTRLYLSN